jgi:parvulin-like peptidyl-prolyl isomerase
MRRILHFTMCALFLLPAAMAPAFAGEVIDSVVVTVNNKPIFRSDWDEAVCYELFMQRKSVAQVTDADRVTALQRLIDRQLLKAQMGNSQALQPSVEDLQNDVAKLRAQLPEGKDDQSWQKMLASYGLSDELLKTHLRTEVLVMNFVEVRLRPNVHIEPAEIETYYKNQLLPDLEKAGGGKWVSFHEVEPRIRELLTQQHMDELLDAWLHNLRQQAEIRTIIPIPAPSPLADQSRASGTH